MSAPPRVRLAEVLSHNTDYIEPEARTYPKLSVKLYGRGVVLDAPTDGAVLKMKRHQLARAGQVILSEIWGKKGAVGLVPLEGTGALCTSHFFLFDVNEERLDRGYLDLIFRANYLAEQLEAFAHGTTGYAAVRPRHLLSLEIPLPPLPEQRRVVARIEEVAGLVEEARILQREVAQELLNTARALILNDAEKALVPLSELVRLRPPDVTVQPSEYYEFAGVYSFGRGVFPGLRKAGLDFSYPRLTRLRAGDFVYPKLMAWEGAFGVVPPNCAGRVVSTEFPVFEILAERVLPEVLDVYFRDPAVWPAISGSSIGTNVRRRRLNPQDFLRWKLPVPSRRTQQRLRELVISADEVGKLQSESSAALDALLPAVLDRAFRGEF